MQKRHFTRATLVAAALAITLPFGAMAFQGKQGHGKHHAPRGECQMPGGFMKSAYGMHGGGMMRSLQRLDLSEAQEDKIFELMHQRAPNMRQQMKALKKNERELQALRQSAQFDEAQAKALIDNIARQRADIELSRLQGERQVLDVLTPEQRQKLQDLRAEEPRRMGERAPRA